MPDPRKTKTVRPRRDTRKFDPTMDPSFATVPAEAEQPSGSERLLHAFWEIAKTVAFIILAAVIIRTFLLQPFFVQGESMETTFQDGNYLLVNQIAYTFGQPKRGDVVVFKAPPEPETNYIKRIIGLPGETVELKNNQVVVFNAEHRDGLVLDEPYEPPNVKTFPESAQTRWEIGADQYFVLGDNREPDKSSDSRAWGLVDKKLMVGKVWLRVYPLSEVGLVKHAEYPGLSFLGSDALAFHAGR